MSQKRCCLCWNIRKKYREVVSPMKEKHSNSCEKFLSVDVKDYGSNNGSLFFCFCCFDTVTRLSLITDKLNEIQQLFSKFTSSFAKQVEISRQQAIPNRPELFKNIAEQIVASNSNGQGPPKTFDISAIFSAKKKINLTAFIEKVEDESKEGSEFENFAVNSCLQNYEYSSVDVPKGGASRATFFQNRPHVTISGIKSSEGIGRKRELRVKMERLKLSSGKTCGIFYCPICRKELKTQAGYNMHNSFKHGIFNSSGPPIPVANSSKLGYNSVRTDHLSSTSSFGNYICNVCHKRFKKASQLVRHQLVHSGNKYPCQQCDMIFSNVSRLDLHVKVVHLKVIVFECSICGRHFANNRNRRNHEKSQHGTMNSASTEEEVDKEQSFVDNSSVPTVEESEVEEIIGL